MTGEIRKGLAKPNGDLFHCAETYSYTQNTYFIIRALYRAAKSNTSKGYLFAVVRAYLTEKIRSENDVIARLKAEYSFCKN